MQETIEAVRKFNAQKRKDIKTLWIVATLSLVFALAADAAASIGIFQQMLAMPHAQIRAWIYVVLGYLVLVPVSLVFQKASMRNFSPRHGHLADRVFILVLATSVFLPAFFLPEAILVFGVDAIGRSGWVYRGMCGSIPGLALTGTFVFYGAAACVWFLSAAIRGVFIKQPSGQGDR